MEPLMRCHAAIGHHGHNFSGDPPTRDLKYLGKLDMGAYSIEAQALGTVPHRVPRNTYRQSVMELPSHHGKRGR